MEIAVHVSNLPDAGSQRRGGGIDVAYTVGRGLATRGHSVTIYGSGVDDSGLSGGSLYVDAMTPWFEIGETPVTPKQFVPNRSKPDLIHAHNTTPPGMISAALHARFADAPLVVTHHGNDRYTPMGSVPSRFFDYLFSEKLLDVILRRTKLITIPSRSYLEESPRMRRYESKTREIPNGIDHEYVKSFDADNAVLDRFEVDEDNTLVLFVGSLSPKKSPGTLLDAASGLPPDVTVVVAGDGAQRAELEQGPPANVRVPGFVSEAEKFALYHRADVYCLPSVMHTEVHPISLLEAYATRTPVVVSDLATFERHVDDGETGLFFERGNVEMLREQLRTLAEDPSYKERLAEQAYERSLEYSWSEIIPEYERCLQSVLDDGPQ